MNRKAIICKSCNKEYIPTSSTEKFCPECRHVYNRHQLDRIVQGLSPDIIIQCPICGTSFKKKGKDKFCINCINTTTSYYRRTYTPILKTEVARKKRESMVKNYIHHKLQQCKKRALLKGIEFNLTEEDIIIPEICPILEVPLVIGTAGKYEYSPSIDRINNSKGYVKGNVMVISKKANSMKNSATPQELEVFIRNIKRYSLTNSENETIESKDKEL